ncbi:MAG TPA: hypothetical protein VKB71_07935 [Rhizomicrobium sp.]|nr:hypothetical protein [Rhizomicrobium sp.]
MTDAERQKAICRKYGARPSFVIPGLKLGISKDFDKTHFPINGLRHPPEGDTCGWYLWSGMELSEADDFFVPIHVAHLSELCPDAIKFLALPPGWRFLFAPDYEDVWQDSSLLEI